MCLNTEAFRETINKNIGNKPYSDKKTEYKKSEIEATKVLASAYPDWDTNSIVERAKSLKKVVDQIWRIP